MVRLVALLLIPVGVLSPVRAQDPPAKKIRTIKFTLVFTRPGAYSCYPIMNGAKGAGIEIVPGQNTLPVEVSTNIEGVEVLDKVSGLVAAVPIRKIRRNSRVSVKPEDFNQLQSVIVKLLSRNGQPAAKGVIRLTPDKGEPLQYGLSTMDGGSVRFENIPLGKAEVKAYSNTGDDVVKKKVIIAPAIGGKGQVILMTLPIDVLTVKPSPAPSKVVDTKPEPRNDLASGVVGIGILVGAWFFGANYLKKRGLTPKEAFTDALGKLGVDTPGAPVPGSEHSGLRASAPDVVQTPLASLGDLPPASAIPAPVEPVRALPGAHLVGLAGAVAGQNIAMSPDKESMITVGRDTKCTVPLPNDSMVSRRHAVFASSGSSWDLMDEASTNGTFLNGKRIENRTTLMSGDEIQIGMARFRYEGERRKTPVAAGGAAMEA